MTNILELLPLLGIVIVGVFSYFKGRDDSLKEQLHRENKVLKEYDKITNEKVTRDEVYKKKKW